MGTALCTPCSPPQQRCACLPEEAAVQQLQSLWQALHAEAQQSRPAPAPVPLWLACSVLWHLAQWRPRCDGPPRIQGRHALYTRWLVLVEKHYAEHWPITRYAEPAGAVGRAPQPPGAG